MEYIPQMLRQKLDSVSLHATNFRPSKTPRAIANATSGHNAHFHSGSNLIIVPIRAKAFQPLKWSKAREGDVTDVM
jgi:hypothetical protein